MQEPVATPFSNTSTCDEVIAGIDLTGKLAVITGGSVGLGKETARALGAAGADLFLGARTIEALESAKAELQGQVKGQVDVARLDLSAPASVDAFADAVLALGRPIDLLINNAGIMACPEGRDPAGNEIQFATNFLGHAVLTSRLSGALKAAGKARLVSLSSVGHHYSGIDFDDINFEKREYERWVAYGQSKTANALLARKVADELGASGVKAFAVHPGLIMTDLAKYLTPEDLQQSAESLKDYMDYMQPMKTVESGAATSVWAATSPLLEDRNFAYLEDCKVAQVVEQPNYGLGVLPYAVDEENARKLWALGEQLLNRPLPLA